MPSKNTDRILYILRAVPGAGKTTLAYSLSSHVCSADDFLYEDGEYKWSIDKLSEAHDKCVKLCASYMSNNTEKIVIANTNAHLSDMKKYEDLAAAHNYMVFYLVLENRHGGIDEHNVPQETKLKMANAIKQNIKLI